MTKSKIARARGRPSEFHQELVAESVELIVQGLTDQEIADHFGVSRTSLSRWRLRHPEFRYAVKEAKEACDERVERTLYQKAVGYDVVEQEAVKVKTGQYAEAVEVVDVQKHVQADTGSAIFWLKNRRPKEWRDKQDIELSGGLDITDKLGTREMALAMLQTMREAMEDANVPTIEHGELPEKAPMIPTARPRRRFE